MDTDGSAPGIRQTTGSLCWRDGPANEEPTTLPERTWREASGPSWNDERLAFSRTFVIGPSPAAPSLSSREGVGHGLAANAHCCNLCVLERPDVVTPAEEGFVNWSP